MVIEANYEEPLPDELARAVQTEIIRVRPDAISKLKSKKVELRNMLDDYVKEYAVMVQIDHQHVNMVRMDMVRTYTSWKKVCELLDKLNVPNHQETNK